MDEPFVRIRLAGDRRVFYPGESLEGEYRFETTSFIELRAIELAVLWHTFGKGDEDMSVHYFDRREMEAGAFDPRRPHPFVTLLPASPLSYEGQIVKIRWCVRVRVFLPRAKTVVTELPFQLGSLVAPHPNRDR